MAIINYQDLYLTDFVTKDNLLTTFLHIFCTASTKDNITITKGGSDNFIISAVFPFLDVDK